MNDHRKPTHHHLPILASLLAASLLAGLDIHVSPLGRDGAAGTREDPSRSLADAQALVRRKLAADPGLQIDVMIAAGEYRLADTLRLTPEDCPADSQVTWRAAPGASVLISGGEQLEWTSSGADWRAVPREGAPEPEMLRVGAGIAPPSRWPDAEQHDETAYLRIERVGNTGGKRLAHRWPPGGTGPAIQGGWWIELGSPAPPIPDGMLRIGVRKVWSAARLRGRRDARDGIISIDGPLITGEHINMLPHATGFGLWLEAHPDLPRRPGTWAWDQAARSIIYRPREGEDPAAVPGVIGRLPRLIEVSGVPGRGMGRLAFHGLTFIDAASPLPIGGVDDFQAVRTHLDFSPSSDPAADPAPEPRTAEPAVLLRFASRVAFVQCRFTGLAGHGIAVGTGCSEVDIRECRFDGIGAVPIVVGTVAQPSGSPPLVHRIVVADCRISHGGVIHPGAPGIWCGLVRNVVVERNQLADLPYSGISMGWSWNDTSTGAGGNRISDNLVERVLGMLADGAGIYCLGDQPDSAMSGNILTGWRRDLHHPRSKDRHGIYLDQGSQGWTMSGNWIAAMPGFPFFIHKPGIRGDNAISDNHVVPNKDRFGWVYRTAHLRKAGDGAGSVVFTDNRAYGQAEWQTLIRSRLQGGLAGGQPGLP